MTSFTELLYWVYLLTSCLCHPPEHWKPRALWDSIPLSNRSAGWLPWSLWKVAKETPSGDSFVDCIKFQKEFYLPMSEFKSACFIFLAYLPDTYLWYCLIKHTGQQLAWWGKALWALWRVLKQRSISTYVLSACLPFICGLHFNLFLIAYLAHLAIKVKWLFDKCESFLISANCFC